MKLLAASAALAVSLSAVLVAPAMAQSSPVEGVWLTMEKSEMTIAPCVEGFCGYITKIVVPQRIIEQYGEDLAAIGTNYTDQLNPDPAKRNRPIQDLQILTLRQAGNPWVYEGEIYSPEHGETFAAFIEVLGPDQIKVKGCTMMVLCGEQIWTRGAVAQ